MIRLVLLAAVLLSGCINYGGQQVDPSNGNQFRYYHDAEHGASCWAMWQQALSCLPDKDVRP